MVSHTTETQADYYPNQKYSKYIKEKSMQDVLQRNAYENCYECGDALKKVRHLRTEPKLCSDCRGHRQSNSTSIREIYVEMKKNPITEIDPLEQVFLDDPRAIFEQEPSFRRSTNR